MQLIINSPETKFRNYFNTAYKDNVMRKNEAHKPRQRVPKEENHKNVSKWYKSVRFLYFIAVLFGYLGHTSLESKYHPATFFRYTVRPRIELGII